MFSDNYEPNIEAENQGRGDLKWMIAGPHFLYGLPTALDFRGKSDIYSDYKAFTDAGGKGIVPAGSRGKQRVSIINRIVANKGAVTKLRKSLKSHIGRAKAAWAQSAQALGETNIPEWISKHFPTPKSITFKQTFGDKPSITIGSSAPGVEKAAPIFQRKLKSRLNSMVARTKLHISGYSRDVAQGIRPLAHAHETQPEGE